MQVIAVTTAFLASVLPAVHAASAIVHNQCNFDVYLWSVTADHAPAQPIQLAPGGRYSESYQSPSQGGVSIKLSTTTSVTGPITQFEYTYDSKIWYDISNVNCKGTSCPFQPHGIFLESSNTGCPNVDCPAGELLCQGAYNNPDDDWASLACANSEDTAVFLCQKGVTKKDEIPTASSTLVSSVRASATASATPAAKHSHAKHPHQRP